MATQFIPSSIEPVDTSRFEQVNGKLIERPVPTLKHSDLQFHITSLLRQAVLDLGMKANQELSIDHLDEPKSDWLTPDVVVSLAGGFRQAKNGHVLPPVLLAVEVLSPGQNFFNMRRKVSDLLAWGVEQVWLVDDESHSIAVFQSSNAKSEVFYEGSVPLPGTSLPFRLEDLFRC